MQQHATRKTQGLTRPIKGPQSLHKKLKSNDANSWRNTHKGEIKSRVAVYQLGIYLPLSKVQYLVATSFRGMAPNIFTSFRFALATTTTYISNSNNNSNNNGYKNNMHLAYFGCGLVAADRSPQTASRPRLGLEPGLDGALRQAEIIFSPSYMFRLRFLVWVFLCSYNATYQIFRSWQWPKSARPRPVATLAKVIEKEEEEG